VRLCLLYGADHVFFLVLTLLISPFIQSYFLIVCEPTLKMEAAYRYSPFYPFTLSSSVPHLFSFRFSYSYFFLHLALPLL
jgi:hypothetical protein